MLIGESPNLKVCFQTALHGEEQGLVGRFESGANLELRHPKSMVAGQTTPRAGNALGYSPLRNRNFRLRVWIVGGSVCGRYGRCLYLSYRPLDRCVRIAALRSIRWRHLESILELFSRLSVFLTVICFSYGCRVFPYVSLFLLDMAAEYISNRHGCRIRYSVAPVGPGVGATHSYSVFPINERPPNFCLEN